MSLKSTKDSDKPNGPYVIVIGRQFGSGARRIGKIIASLLGFDYYDSELLSHAAERLGFAKEIFIENDEKKPSTLRTLLQGAYGIADNFHPVSLSGEGIYAEQSRVIKDICKERSSVIVGRTADYILRNHPSMLSVFLHSPVEIRAEAIVRRGEADNIDDAIDIARRRDKRREAYYNFYTGEDRWGKADNYHLSIDTSGLDEKTVAELIVSVAKSKFLGIE